MRYFVISATYNAIIDQADAPYSGNVPWSKMPGICAQIAPAEEEFARAVQQGPWPADHQDEADELARASAASAGQLYDGAAAKSASGAADAMADPSLETASQAGASATRLALGLPIDR